MIKFIRGMCNTPGALDFRKEWKRDKKYRWVIKGMCLFFIAECLFFYFYS